MIKLGLFVEDKVTGFIGVTENRATFLYGCDRYHIQPQVDKDGKIPEGRMIDEPQLKIIVDKGQAMEPMKEPKQLISLGNEVHDPIIDKKGTATGRAVYLNGCSRIFIEPKHKLLTADIEGWWADEQQIVQKKKVTHKPQKNNTRKGGPARSCSRH